MTPATCPAGIRAGQGRSIWGSSAIGYVAPAHQLAGREPVIFAERDRKLDEARARRKVARQAARTAVA